MVLRPIDLALVGKALAGAMALIFTAQFLLILAAGRHAGAVSPYFTAALVATAAACVLWRALLLPWRERPPWIWAALGILLWSAARTLENSLAHSLSGSGRLLAANAPQFLYVSAIFLFLIALSTTHATQPVRALSVLHFAQISVALFLTWLLLNGTALSPAREAIVMERICAAAGVLLAATGLLRLFWWISKEERQCFLTINILIWTYLPVELGLDYLSHGRRPSSGTLLDLLWSVPFALTGWNALIVPLNKTEEPAPAQQSRARLVAESVCPLLLTTGIFALAAAVIPQFLAIGLAAMFLLLVAQGFEAAMVQANYLVSHNLLLDREHKLRTANAALEQLTLLDPLTGVSNRRAFDSAFAAAWRRALRRHYPLALLIVDVDFFKAINDLHGHVFGDECLVALARVLDSQAQRPDDLLARLGGEEFILLLPETSADGAVHVARRLHDSVRKLALVNDGSPFDRLLTISIGIAICVPAPGMQPAALFEAADQALYSAKDQGRNRTFSVLLRPEGSEVPVAHAGDAGPAPQSGTE
jgi:diguanylate cyclase (GGDEF)-like protein